MKHLIFLLFVASVASAQSDVFERAAQVLNWKIAKEVTTTQLAPGSSQQAIDAARSSSSGQAIVYRVDRPLKDAAAWTGVLATASNLKADVVIGAPSADHIEAVQKAAAENHITFALDAGSSAYLDPDRVLSAVQKYDKKVRVWGNVEAWEKAGTKPLAAIYMLREYLAGATLGSGRSSDDFVREADRLDIKPLLWTTEAPAERLAKVVDPLILQRTSRRGYGRRVFRVTPEERVKVEAAIPATAPAVPKKPRKLLVFDLNVGRGGHPAIPHANLAMQLMGQKTGAFEATVTSEPSMLYPAQLKEFDAVYLNNTIGDIFATPEVREGFVSFVKNGGGLIGNHATTVTATDYPEFANMLGGQGASHRMVDEKLFINVEEPNHPVAKALGTAPFEYEDEFFRVQGPYSRDKLRVLASINTEKSDLNQGRCYGQCYRDDNDYAVAWVKQYGKGRVFYTVLGHNSHVFWDPKMLQMFLAGVQFALGDLEADATPRKQTVSELDKVVEELAQYDFGQDEGPVRRLDRAMGLLGPSKEAGRDAESKLLSVLKKHPKLGAIDAVCRQLATVGSAASVPALSPLLSDKQTADMARYALERIDAPQAVAALRTALAMAPDDRIRTGIIHSLARRRDASSVPSLQKLMTGSEETVAAAATNALGMIGSPEAEQTLFAAKMTPQVSAALLTLAEQAPAARATSIYTKLNSASNTDEVRLASINGLGKHGNVDAVRKALQDPSADVQTAAVLNLARLDAGNLLKSMDTLAPAIRIQALNALVAQGENSARTAALAAAKSGDAAIRVAGLQALAEVGKAEDVSLLVAAASGTTAAEQAAARNALTRLPGEDVDAAIVGAIPAAQPKTKVELIRAVGERGAVSAQDTLLAAVSDSNASIRRESLRALRGIASADKAPSLLDLLLKSSEDDRKETEQALAAAIGRSSKPDVKFVVDALEKSQDGEIRASLLSVLALTGEKDALPVLRTALAAQDTAVQRAAVNGLSGWSSAEPMNDLLEKARASNDPSIKGLALRGYIRLVQRPAGRSAAENAKLLGAAMEVASRPDEKKVVLAAVQRVVSPESLKIAQSAASDPAVAAEANLAASTIEKALSARGR